MAETREHWWVRHGSEIEPGEVEFRRQAGNDVDEPVQVWLPGNERPFPAGEVVLVQRIAPPGETLSAGVSALAARIVDTLEAMRDRDEDFADREPLIAIAQERYSALKSQGRDFTTSARISKTELVAALIARTAVEPIGLEDVTREMLDACRVAMKRHIESVPDHEERERRWGKPVPGVGYRIPEDEKAEVRYRAMRAAAAAPVQIDLKAEDATIREESA